MQSAVILLKCWLYDEKKSWQRCSPGWKPQDVIVIWNVNSNRKPKKPTQKFFFQWSHSLSGSHFRIKSAAAMTITGNSVKDSREARKKIRESATMNEWSHSVINEIRQFDLALCRSIECDCFDCTHRTFLPIVEVNFSIMKREQFSKILWVIPTIESHITSDFPERNKRSVHVQANLMRCICTDCYVHKFTWNSDNKMQNLIAIQIEADLHLELVVSLKLW